jgi:heme A synthase
MESPHGGRHAGDADPGDRHLDSTGGAPALAALAGGSCFLHRDRTSHSRRTYSFVLSASGGFHGARHVAQTFFCIAVAIALFTGRKWVEEQPRAEFDPRRPSLFTLTLLSIFVLYVQLILGGMFRHHGMSWWPHVVNAVIVAFVLAWTAIRALSVYSQIEALRRPAIVMLSLLITQLCLGFTAFLTRVAWGKDAAQPELPMVAATVAHVAVGALSARDYCGSRDSSLAARPSRV